jgi:tetratricopeptide (TPR) repeat protein
MRQAVTVYPEAVSHHAMFLGLTGRLDEAFGILHSNADDDPNPVRPNLLLATAYYGARRYEEAVDQARRTIGIDVANATSWELLGDALWELDRKGEALAAWREALQLRRLPELVALLDRTAAESGPDAALRAVSRARLEQLRARAELGDYVPAYTRARLALRAGDPGPALDRAVEAFAERNRLALDILTDPVFDPLRAEPRFVEGVRSLGLPLEIGTTRPTAP